MAHPEKYQHFVDTTDRTVCRLPHRTEKTRGMALTPFFPVGHCHLA